MSAGRKTKLTLELQDEIIRVIQAGNYIETACAYAGIHKSTIYEWLKRGAREKQRLADNPRAQAKKSEKPFMDFHDLVEKAMAQAEIRDVALIAKAAADNWQAAAWRLERKFPEKWGRKDKQTIEHTGKDGGPIETIKTEKLDLTGLTDEELAALENIITKQQNDDDDGDPAGAGTP